MDQEQHSSSSPQEIEDRQHKLIDQGKIPDAESLLKDWLKDKQADTSPAVEIRRLELARVLSIKIKWMKVNNNFGK